MKHKKYYYFPKTKLPILLTILAATIVFAAISVFIAKKNAQKKAAETTQPPADNPVSNETPGSSGQTGAFVSKDFIDFNNGFQFKGNVPSSWHVEYVESSDAINLFDPKANGETSLDQSQIFIKKYTANDFNISSKVDVLSKQTGTLDGHQTVLYEIEKKAGVPNSPGEPAWRNNKHFVLDLRSNTQNPGAFYEFAKNPALPEKDFSEFVDSLFFYSDQKGFLPPIMDYKDRITKKPFGIYITPQTSPVQPERFTGYHTGTDFEIFPDELNKEVTVHAICYGEVIQKGQISGYGGVIIQQCTLNGQPITVLYGHLSFSAEFTRNVGKYLVPGDLLATLGANKSTETDGERKHLHLGIHKGKEIDVRGYVDSKSELSNWINFEKYVE